MVYAGCLIGLILGISCSLVAGLCSTCIDGKCHDNGECIIGCVPGYVGEYCDEACPSRCLNKVCHVHIVSGAITCTDGCEPGYCDIKCEVKCPRDCVTCDRECTSCNMTLCPERRYGADCSEMCSPRYEKCDRETGQCIRCSRGYFGDECTRDCPGCFTPAANILDTCLSGCEICQSEEICPVGFYGDSCELKCSTGCENQKGCNRATGECSDGCVSGYHGLTCNYTCNEHCLSGRCNRATGECSAGCVSRYHGLTCNYTCNSFCEGGVCNQHDGVCTSGCISGYKTNLYICEKYDNEGFNTTVAIAILIIILACLVIGMVTAVVIRRRRRSRRCSRRDENFLEIQELLMPAELNEKAERQVLDLWKKTKTKIKSLTSGMIHVSAVDTVVDMLQSGRNWVTITGNAGDGKTIVGFLVLKELQNRQRRQKKLGGNINVYSIEEPEECRLLLSLNTRLVIMLDDRFGAFTSDQVLVDKWKDVINDIHKHFTNEGNQIKIIFISRKNVVNEARDYLGYCRDSILDPDNVVDLSLLKITNERLQILDHYLTQSKLKESSEVKQRVVDLDIAHGFPHCSMMYPKLKVKKSDLHIEEFFKTPLNFLDITTAVLIRENCKDLFKLMIKNNGKFDAYSVKDDARRATLLKVEREQEGSYITVWKNGVCMFAHPSIYESVLSVICETDPLFCVKYATLSVIRQKLTLTSDEKQMSPTQINVKPVPAVLKALAERFRQGILQGYYTVFGHRLCDNEDFCKELVASCVYSGTPTPEQNGSKQFINQPGKDGDTMLWKALLYERMSAVHILVKAGADVAIQDKKGRTPLHHVCQLKISTGASAEDNERSETRNPVDLDTVRLIINEGRGDVNISDNFGQTPLHYLFKYCAFAKEEIQWIITQGKGDLNKCEQHRSTPLHYLCANPSLQLDTVDLVDVLIKEGKGDFNKGDEHGTTPFHYLCENGKIERGVVVRVVNTAKGDINKQDDNGITPLHVLCKGSLLMKDILTLINQGDKADMYGNTPLHFLCRRRGINAEILHHELEQLFESDMKKQNYLGYTPSDYLTDQDDILPWTDAMIARSASDLVLCRLKIGKSWIFVLGRAMILNSGSVHKLLQVEDFGRVLTNMAHSGDRYSPGQFSFFYGTRSSPVPLPPAPYPLTTPPSYWETSSTLTRRKRGLLPLLEMGLMAGMRNLDEEVSVSHLPDSVCVSVWDICSRHLYSLCIQVWRRDKEDRRHQIGECVTLSLPTLDVEFNLTFGLVLDVGRGRVGIIDLERGELLCKEDLEFEEWVFPMFFVSPFNCTTRMRLISGREICVTDRKIKLIQQALSN